MRKKIFLVFGSVALLLIVALATLVIKLNDIVSGLRPQIESQLSAALGATVQVREISASIFPATSLTLRGVNLMADDKSKAALSIAEARATVALRPLLTKSVEVSEIAVDSPVIKIIKDASGVQIDGIRMVASSSASPTLNTSGSATTSSPASLNLKISRITLVNGKVTIHDKASGQTTTVQEINLDAGVEVSGQNISIPRLALSFTPSSLPELSFTGSSLSYAKDTGALSIGSLDAQSKVGAIHAEGSVSAFNLTGALTVTSKGADLRKLGEMLTTSHPSLSAMNLSGSIGADLKVSLNGSPSPQLSGPITLREINATLPGGTPLKNLSGLIKLQGSPSDLALSTRDLKLTLKDTALSASSDARFAQDGVTVQSLTINGLGGEIRSQIKLRTLKPETFSIQENMTTISIGEVLKLAKSEFAQTLSGTITTAKGTFSGPCQGEIARAMSGSGDMVINDSVIKGINLPNLVLSKVSNIPLLEGTLRSHIAPEHQRYFNDPNTTIKELRLSFVMASGTVTISSLTATSSAFALQSNGTLSVDGDLNLSSTMTLSSDISKALGARSKTLRSMLNREGQLAIPVVIRGRSPSILVSPDISKLLEGAAGDALKEKAGGLLQKALGGKSNGQKKSPLSGLFGK